jgi:hypothetical protein
MTNSYGEYINGYIERKSGGGFDGALMIESIDISPIIAVAFKEGDKTYLWLRRKDMLVYDEKTQQYKTRKREPRWEAYLEKQMDGNTVAYKGEFHFLMFKYEIVGVWDKVFGKEKSRMNFFVERLPMEKQDIINGINKRKSSNDREGSK